MKKILYAAGLFSTILFVSSCSTDEIEYPTHPAEAEVRTIMALPEPTSATNNIAVLKYNDKVYSQVSTAPGSGWPNSAGKFHSVPAGQLNVKLSRNDAEVYNQNITIVNGKQTQFIYDLSQPPLRFDEGWPYDRGHGWNDTIQGLNFVNLLYIQNAQGQQTPITGTLQLLVRTGSSPNYVYARIGNPVAFGEHTGWIQYHIPNPAVAGTQTVYLMLEWKDAAGNVLTLPYLNNSGVQADFAQSFTAGKGYFSWLYARGIINTGSYDSQVLSIGTYRAV